MKRPEPQQNLREAIRRAFDSVAGVEPEALAERAGGRLSADGHGASGRTVELDVLGRTVVADLDAREVRLRGGAAGGGARVDDAIAAVVARYLALSGGLAADAGPEIGFADCADARGYLGPFRGRVLAPLVRRFGRDPDSFARAAEGLGGERAPGLEGSGGTAYRLRVFPRLPVTFIFHPGDDEFAPEAVALFPRAAFEVLAVDDVVAAADLASRALRGRLWRGQEHPQQ